MLVNIDRYQIAVTNSHACVKAWQHLLGAELAGIDEVIHLNATRTRLRLGIGFIEILEPKGSGIVADALDARGPHFFAAGASTHDMAGVAERLAKFTDNVLTESGQMYVLGADVGIPGLRLVISQHEERPSVGAIDYIYEATLLAADAQQQTERFAEVFNLDAQSFVNIDSPRFGYNGTLTLFKESELHRFEVISPINPETTMARFFQKIGPCLYMGFAETNELWNIEQKTQASNLGMTIDRPEDRSDALVADQIWMHPATLGGMMLGLSRPSMAWSWSGSPERVTTVS